jgi:hypothetical protein
MLKERKIRKGNIIILYSLETDDVDYYLVTEKDLVMLADNETCLFDNMYIMDFIKKWEFSVVFNNEEKQKIISQILSKSS